jgi:hypothetical protein
MIGGEERRGIRLHSEVAFIVTTLDDERLAVVAYAGEELATHPKPGRSVAGTFLYSGKRERPSTHGLKRHPPLLGHWPPPASWWGRAHTARLGRRPIPLSRLLGWLSYILSGWSSLRPRTLAS